MNIKHHAIEFFGTFILTLAIFSSLVLAGGITTPLTAGITLGLLAFMLGSLTCLHLNPAVTIAFAAFRKIEWKYAAFHIMAQFAGAALAILFVRLSGSLSPITNDFSWRAMFGEFVGTAFFAFGIASLAFKNPVSEYAEPTTDITFPIIVGASLSIGIMISAALGSNGIVNPAVAFGLNTFNPAYLLGPIAGAAFGIILYRFFAKPAKGDATASLPFDDAAEGQAEEIISEAK